MTMEEIKKTITEQLSEQVQKWLNMNAVGLLQELFRFKCDKNAHMLPFAKLFSHNSVSGPGN